MVTLLIAKIVIVLFVQQYSFIIAYSLSYNGNINVTVDKSFSDPSIIRSKPDVKSDVKMTENTLGRPSWLIFASLQGIKVFSSSNDFSEWHVNGSCFPSGIDWVRAYTYNADNSSIGAPHVSNQFGQYWLFYSTRVPDVIMNFSVVAAIGVATSKTGLPGTWTDKGMVRIVLFIVQSNVYSYFRNLFFSNSIKL